MPVVETTSTATRSTPATVDRVLLEGPHSRLRELWLVLRTRRDFIRGSRGLPLVGPCVTVFGSAPGRWPPRFIP